MNALLTLASLSSGRRTRAVVAVAAAAALSLGVYAAYVANAAAHARPRHSFSVSLAAKKVSLAPGTTARIRLVIHRHGFRARIRFRVVSRPPRGLSARFAPARTRGRRTTLSLKAAQWLRPGRYRLRIRAAAGRSRRTLVLTVTVVGPTAGQARAGQAPPFSIAGNVGQALQPGVPEPIDLVITNLGSSALGVSSLTVAVQGITAPQATAQLPCTLGDFTVQQYSGSPLTVPAGATRSLSDLGIPSSQWPELMLIDRPTDQDGCQGAAVALAYSAAAYG